LLSSFFFERLRERCTRQRGGDELIQSDKLRFWIFNFWPKAEDS